jgi:hypothetical protein
LYAVEQKRPSTQSKPVIDLKVTSDLNGQIGGGGIDIRIKGRRGSFFQPKLSLCTKPILDAASRWATVNKLSVIKKDIRGDGLSLQLANAKTPGLFELQYRLELKRNTAEVTLIYYKADGTPVLPELITIVDAEALDDLQSELTKGLTCNTQ